MHCTPDCRLSIIPGVRVKVTNEMEAKSDEQMDTGTHIKGEEIEELSNDVSIGSLPPIELGDSSEVPSLTESQHEMVLQQLENDDEKYHH